MPTIKSHYTVITPNITKIDSLIKTITVRKLVNVTGFAKMCIVHTSTFSTLNIHKFCYDQQTGMKLAVELISLYQFSKFQILIVFLSCFMNL